jgi:hypothetical protein
MDRRKFLSTLIGGVATAAAVRTFPFRVFSFPSKKMGNFGGLMLDPYPGRLCTPELRLPFSLALGNGVTKYGYIAYSLNKDGIWTLKDADTRKLEIERMYKARQFFHNGISVSEPIFISA